MEMSGNNNVGNRPGSGKKPTKIKENVVKQDQKNTVKVLYKIIISPS